MRGKQWLRRVGCLVGMLCLGAAAAAGQERYSLDDFERVDKIDAHVHLNGPAERFMAQAIHDGFRVLTINVDYPDFPSVDVQQSTAVSLRARYPGRVAFAATIEVAGFQSPGWAAGELRRIDEALAQGAVGVKVWKNIGMALRDPNGRFVMLDDARFSPIFDRLEHDHIALLGHQADPLNSWLPFNRMTIRSDRDYYRDHPQYYMYRHPEVPALDAQLAARDRMLSQHPRLAFDAVHLATLEWDVDRVARFLDRFPQASVDVAARMNHLEYQAAHNPGKVRRFLIRYQDRILYGTDIEVGPGASDTAAAAEARDTWREDWRFLTGSGTLHSPEFAAPFRGLALPRSVVDKIYASNARRVFAGAWQ